MSTFYDAPNDYRNYLCHYGIKGMNRPHGLKYKKRGSSLREHRLNQVKTVTRQELEQRRADQEHERLAGEQETRINNRRAERHHDFEEVNRRREADRIAAEKHDEDKRRRQQVLEEENRHRAEAEAMERANTKAYHQTIHPLNKNLSRLADQVSPQRVHRRNSLLNQTRRVRRRHGH